MDLLAAYLGRIKILKGFFGEIPLISLKEDEENVEEDSSEETIQDQNR